MDRRYFIKLLGLAGTSATAYTACSAYMETALAKSATTVDDLLTFDVPRCKGGGKLSDIEHVVILMQENRSFDHYFGTLRGVRGFGDPRPLRLFNGNQVWEQSDGAKPFRLPKKPANEAGIDGEAIPTDSSGSVFLQDPAHDFVTGLGAWHYGRMDQWKENKDYVAMAHYTEQDIPLFFRLAKTFTLCDAYFCSHNGPTDPNRSFLFTGTCMGKTDNKYFSGLGASVGASLESFFGFGSGSGSNTAKPNWKSFPEKLEEIGVDWKFYQDGLGWPLLNSFAGNFGDNTLEYFEQFRDKTTSIYKKNQSVNSVLRTDAAKPSQFEKDIIDGKLPEISWIVAPEAFSEHPKYPPHFGEYYIHEILRAFAANKAVWQKTLFLINYDENGGFFDHVLPPVPPLSSEKGKTSPGITLTDKGTINSETSIDQDDPIGMGVRVPMLVISPWSMGGRVCSEVFDHTSVIRFLDKWLIARGKQKDTGDFANISSWRRAVAGDLTSALDFGLLRTNDLDRLVAPSVKALILTDTDRSNANEMLAFAPERSDIAADPDADKPILAKQDRTRCEILPVAYDFQAYFRFGSEKRVEWVIRNSGRLGASFYVIPYSQKDNPWYYTVEGVAAGASTPIELTGYAENASRTYDYAIHGPNGYLFEFSGDSQDSLQAAFPEIVDVKSVKEAAGLQFTLSKWGSANGKLKAINAYTGEFHELAANGVNETVFETATSDGWYDIALVDAVNTNNFLRRYAGHLENGKVSTSDPAIGLKYNPKTRLYETTVA
jgi:phospholipase C